MIAAAEPLPTEKDLATKSRGTVDLVAEDFVDDGDDV